MLGLEPSLKLEQGFGLELGLPLGQESSQQMRASLEWLETLADLLLVLMAWAVVGLAFCVR
jgi:hypothetical protein